MKNQFPFFFLKSPETSESEAYKSTENEESMIDEMKDLRNL